MRSKSRREDLGQKQRAEPAAQRIPSRNGTGNVDGFHPDGIDVLDALRFQIFDGEPLGVQPLQFNP